MTLPDSIDVTAVARQVVAGVPGAIAMWMLMTHLSDPTEARAAAVAYADDQVTAFIPPAPFTAVPMVECPRCDARGEVFAGMDDGEPLTTECAMCHGQGEVTHETLARWRAEAALVEDGR